MRFSTSASSVFALAIVLGALQADAQPAPAKPASAGAGAAPTSKPAVGAPSPTVRTTPQKAVLPRVINEAMVKVARDLYVQGAEALAQGKPAEARASFFAAIGLNRHWSILCNLGDADMRLGRYVLAAEEIAECAEGMEKDSKPSEAEKGAVRKLYGEAKAKVVELVVRSGRSPGMGEVKMTVDNGLRGTNGDELVMFVEPGKHSVRMECAGYESLDSSVEGEAGTRKEVVGVWKKSAVVPSATATASAAPTVEAPQRSLVPAVVMGGVGVASLIAGGVLIGVAEARHAQLVTEAPRDSQGELLCRRAPTSGSATAECDAWRSKLDGTSLQGTVAIGLLIGGGLVGGVGAVYALWPQKTPTPGAHGRDLHVLPSASKDGGGLVVTGRF